MPLPLRNRRIFFWCCKPLGLRCLQYLLELKQNQYSSLEITGVCIAETDSTHPMIEEVAQSHDIPLFTEQDAAVPKSDLGLVVGFPFKIPITQIDTFQNGIINLHFAPLPQYRGSGTLSQAIINQETEYGVTFHFIDPNIDTGPIIETRMMPLPPDQTAAEITQLLEQLAFKFFQDKIEIFLTQPVLATPQSVLIEKLNIIPHRYTRDSVEKLYALDRRWPLEKLYRYTRALTLNKGERPYFDHNGQRLYLSIR